MVRQEAWVVLRFVVGTKPRPKEPEAFLTLRWKLQHALAQGWGMPNLWVTLEEARIVDTGFAAAPKAHAPAWLRLALVHASDRAEATLNAWRDAC